MFRRKRVVKEGLAPIYLKDCIIVRKIVILPKIRRMSYLAGTGGAFQICCTDRRSSLGVLRSLNTLGHCSRMAYRLARENLSEPLVDAV